MEKTIEKCLFCGSKKLDIRSDVGLKENVTKNFDYICQVCGHVWLNLRPPEIYALNDLSKEQKRSIGTYIRNKFERRHKDHFERPYVWENLKSIIDTYVPMDPIDKMDSALLNLERESKVLTSEVSIKDSDYLYYNCSNFIEMVGLFHLLFEEGFITGGDPKNPHNKPRLTSKGYQKLREIKARRIDSRQCFVAMWFNQEMLKVYNQVIQPAIEYLEEGTSEPRFRAVRLDKVEHINDINDEIIATIRRSRFMVCDLTGYRGGVYFEAGFAYGLGLPVIYTCRKDWAKEQILRTEDGKEFKELYDEDMKPVRIRKEGVHFDLAHRNRIEWEDDTDKKLDNFRVALENRIKAVIV